MVRATNADGFSVAGSEPELVLQQGEESEPPPPQFITPPTISGVAVEGHQLTVHRGSWEDEPLDLRREVVPLQRPQSRRHRRRVQGDHAQEPGRRANPNR